MIYEVYARARYRDVGKKGEKEKKEKEKKAIWMHTEVLKQDQKDTTTCLYTHTPKASGLKGQHKWFPKYLFRANYTGNCGESVWWL